jgi:hypothetical protein
MIMYNELARMQKEEFMAWATEVNSRKPWVEVVGDLFEIPTGQAWI